MKCKFENTGDAIVCWATVAVPFDLAKDLPNQMIFKTITGEKYPAVKLPTNVGNHSVLYSVHGAYPRQSQLDGELVKLDIGDEAKFTDSGFNNFQISNWIGNDLWTKMPYFLVNGNRLEFNSAPGTSEILEISPARVVVKCSFGYFGGFQVNLYAYLYNQQDFVPFSVSVHWSDRDDPSYGPKPISFSMHSKNPITILQQEQQGIAPAVYNYENEVWSVQLLKDKHLRDGQGAYWYGTLLYLPGDFMTGPDYTDQNTQVRLAILNAAKTGNVDGLYMNWGGQ